MTNLKTKNMNFTGFQKLLLALGILSLIMGFSGLGINIFMGIGFVLVCIALCYRKWWVKEYQKLQ